MCSIKPVINMNADIIATTMTVYTSQEGINMNLFIFIWTDFF